MNSLIPVILSSALMTFNLSYSSTSTNTNYRPYISTRIAHTIMSDREDEVVEKCDGSGWITHGDGHKTECPGCTACEDKTPEPVKPEVKYTCKCNTNTTYCNCVPTYGKCSCVKVPVGTDTGVKKKCFG